MLPESTPAVIRALDSAKARALGTGSAEAEPLHLLQGLLEEEDGRAALLLRAAGLAEDARERLSKDGTGVGRPESASIPLGPMVRKALAQARQLSRDLTGEATVASDSLLLALLSVAPPLRDLLEPLGLRFADLEVEILGRQELPLRLDEPLHLPGPTEHLDAARVLDAAANRAREGLRVVEDYCRFVLNDVLLTGELKCLRHDLVGSLRELASPVLLLGRDTQGDVGTALTVSGERERSSLTEVVQANLKRIQEALRSLEEFGKLFSEKLGKAVEQLRYRAYTLERSILFGADMRRRLAEVRLCVLLSADACVTGLEVAIAEAVAGGASMIQLREKGLPDRELIARARRAREWTRRAGALFIVNDRPDLARVVEADGVHLGQDDLPVREARRILGPEALVGVSTHNIPQVRQAILDGASYLGVGPAFPSRTKDFSSLPGLEFVRQALCATTLPAFVIGGINRDTINSAVAAGAARVAVSQAVAASEDPREAARYLMRALEKGHSPSFHSEREKEL